MVNRRWYQTKWKTKNKFCAHLTPPSPFFFNWLNNQHEHTWTSRMYFLTIFILYCYYSTFSTYTHKHTYTNPHNSPNRSLVCFVFASFAVATGYFHRATKLHPVYASICCSRREQRGEKKWINQKNMTRCELALRMYRKFLLSQLSASLFFSFSITFLAE